MKLVSIITVCYNSDKTIKNTIESVLNQDYDNIEYIVVDGASKDKTVEIVKSCNEKFKDRFGREITLISEPDNGIYDAMNKGIFKASGELIGIINSDDSYEMNAVSRAVASLDESTLDEKSNLYVIYGGINRYSTDGKLISKEWYSHEFLDERMIAHPATFVSKALYEKLGAYDTKYPSAADYEFMLRIKDNPSVKFIPIYEMLANFTMGGKCNSLRGYEDKLKMLHDKGKIKGLFYFLSILSLRIRMFFEK